MNMKLNFGAVFGVILGGYIFFSTSLAASGSKAQLTFCLLAGAALGTLIWNFIRGSKTEYETGDSKTPSSDRSIYIAIGFVIIAVLIAVALLVTGIWNPMAK